MKSAKAAIALGSNLGDSLSTLENAIATLATTTGISVYQRSSWYETLPVGPPQPNYLNGCALLRVKLKPEELLATLRAIEDLLGRTRKEPWGPRTLDLDLLLFEDLILETPTLQVPHPRMRERAFVLIPLAEIAPDWVDPVSRKAIAELTKSVDATGVCLLENLPTPQVHELVDPGSIARENL